MSATRNGDALGADLLGEEKPKSARMVSFSTYIRPDQAEALKEWSRVLNMPQAAFVRKAIDLAFADWDAKLARDRKESARRDAELASVAK